MNIILKKHIAIAIDGPAAAGKSTVAKLVAQNLSYIYIDTGAMYRALTLSALNANLNVNNENELIDLLDQLTIDLIQNDDVQKVLVNKIDVTKDIRTEWVTNNVSYVSAHADIRAEMVKRQQELATNRGVVMDGRDIGTHVLPVAELKFFLIATVEERAKRRYEENVKKGMKTSLEKLKNEIEQRDSIDSKRENSPLIKADDAKELDTTSLTINDVSKVILGKAHEILRAN